MCFDMSSAAAAVVIAAAAAAAAAETVLAAEEQDQDDDKPEIAVAAVSTEHFDYPFPVRCSVPAVHGPLAGRLIVGEDGPSICAIVCPPRADRYYTQGDAYV